ncbi:MAG: Fis family transcriptional regulator [Pseudomonadales bacterium]|nr:Fis family transcriptional regulator [Pseudomonadales bacterium]
MRKRDKKIENAICLALTEVCEIALETYAGFSWLTHRVNYQRFPDSLSVICVFDTNAALTQFLAQSHDRDLAALIQQHLAKQQIGLKQPKRQISFDTEENCQQSHQGNWQARLAAH